ncbi:hypothetical protein [Brevibacillus sp. SYSU BS000544]
MAAAEAVEGQEQPLFVVKQPLFVAKRLLSVATPPLFAVTQLLVESGKAQ